MSFLIKTQNSKGISKAFVHCRPLSGSAASQCTPCEQLFCSGRGQRSFGHKSNVTCYSQDNYSKIAHHKQLQQPRWDSHSISPGTRPYAKLVVKLLLHICLQFATWVFSNGAVFCVRYHRKVTSVKPQWRWSSCSGQAQATDVCWQWHRHALQPIHLCWQKLLGKCR